MTMNVTLLAIGWLCCSYLGYRYVRWDYLKSGLLVWKNKDMVYVGIAAIIFGPAMLGFCVTYDGLERLSGLFKRLRESGWFDRRSEW